MKSRIIFLRRHYPDQVQGTGGGATPLHLSRTCVQRPCIRFVLRSVRIIYQPVRLCQPGASARQFPQRLTEIVRQRTLHRHARPRRGVDEGEPPGVETLPRQARDGLFRPIDHISQQRVADVGHVHPDLMGAARLQAALDMGMAGVCLLYTSDAADE